VLSSFAKTIFLSPGNITHTPAYGNLIALGVLTAVQSRNASQQRVAEAVAYREMIARTGRFLTYCGGAPIIGQRMRPDPRDRVALMPAGLGSYACLNDDARRRTRGRLLRPWPCSRHDWGGDNPRAAR
jgi:hypothetical protein